jgi:hypothetical protein
MLVSPFSAVRGTRTTMHPGSGRCTRDLYAEGQPRAELQHNDREAYDEPLGAGPRSREDREAGLVEVDALESLSWTA